MFLFHLIIINNIIYFCGPICFRLCGVAICAGYTATTYRVLFRPIDRFPATYKCLSSVLSVSKRPNYCAKMSGFGDNFDQNVDPAAEFLAREQDELAGLEDEVKPAATFAPVLNGGTFQFRGVFAPHKFTAWLCFKCFCCNINIKYTT